MSDVLIPSGERNMLADLLYLAIWATSCYVNSTCSVAGKYPNDTVKNASFNSSCQNFCITMRSTPLNHAELDGNRSYTANFLEEVRQVL